MGVQQQDGCASSPFEVGNDHRLADPEPLAAILKACKRINSE